MRLELYLFSFEDHDTGPVMPGIFSQAIAPCLLPVMKTLYCTRDSSPMRDRAREKYPNNNIKNRTMY